MHFRELCRTMRSLSLVTMLLVLAGWPMPGVSAQGPSQLQSLALGAPLKSAGGIAFDGQGLLYIAEPMGDRIMTMDKETGRILDTVTKVSLMSWDIAFGPEGSLYWTSFSDGTVNRLAPDGTTSSQVVGAGVVPITFSDDGRLFVGLTFNGQGLFELDPQLTEPPRAIVEGHKWQSSMDWGPDGQLYAPLQFEDVGVRVDVGTGVITKILDSAHSMAFDPQGHLYASIRNRDSGIDTITRVDIETISTESIVEIPIGVKNLGFDASGRFFVSHWGDGVVFEILEGGQLRTVSPGGMVSPGGVVLLPRVGGGESVYVADVVNLREFDAATGDPRRNVFSFQVPGAPAAPFTVAADGDNLLLSTFFSNAVQVYDPEEERLLADMRDFKVPMNAIRFQGDYIVAELGTGSVVRARSEDPSPDKRITLAKDLKVPLGLAKSGDGDLYLGDWATGRVLQLAEDGEFLSQPTQVVGGLQFPEGLAVDTDGNLLVVETGTGRLLRIEVATGQISLIAEGLAVGKQAPKNFAPSNVFSGVAVGPSGAIYITGDMTNALYKLAPPIKGLPIDLPRTGHAPDGGLPVEYCAVAVLALIALGLGLYRWTGARR